MKPRLAGLTACRPRLRPEFFCIWQISKGMSIENERRKPDDEVLQKHTRYMRQLLAADGYIG